MDPFTVPVALDNQPSQPHSPPQQQPSVAAASPTAPAAPAAPPTLNRPPPYSEMIYAAITALKNKNGSSKIAIGKYIEKSNSNLPPNHSTMLTQHLQSLKNTGHLLMVKKSYKLPRCDALVPETSNNNNQDNAVNISSSAHGSKTSRGRGRSPHLTPAKRARGRQIGEPPVGPGGRADVAVPKLKRRTKRPVGRPRKVQVHAQVQVQAQPISDAVGKADAAVPKSQVQAQAQPILTVPKSKRRTRRPVGRPRKVQVQAQPILDAVGEADVAVPKSQVQAQAQPILTVPKSKCRTRRPVGRPRKKVQVQAQPIVDAVGEADAAVLKSQVQAQAQPILTVPKSKRRTRRPVGRPRKVQVLAQPISDAVGEAVATVPKSQVQAQAQPILTVPKSKRKTRRPVGRPRKDEVVSQRESLENDVRCLRGELQQVRDDRDRQELRVQALTAELDLKERQLTAVNEKLKMVERQLLDERRKYLNTIVELKGNIRVLCRVRPLVQLDGLGQEASPFSYPTSMDIRGKAIDVLQNGKTTRFTFDKVISPTASQQDVFGEVSDLVQSALDGHKVCIFAYGQTGSGKSFTMIGRPECAEKKGIILRSLEQIFQISQSLKLQASIFEVYKNKIKDLMVENQSTDLTILHDANRDAYVSGLKIVDVGSIEEISSLLQQATQARSVGTTQMNEQSSRSHLVFILRISRVNEGTGQQVHGVLNLIDLAGSDRPAKSGVTRAQLTESQAINLSMSHLRKVITALVEKQDHVPYRDSKLTHILQPYLGKGAKTLMVVNIAPNPSSVGESVRSLQFASTAFGSTVSTVQPTSLQHGDSSKLKSPR